mmetsp:Transcript_17002/g.54528  ORF Transcript_17002/g.54528 Transcript_17002/m.54528 type:complete len:270 (+) Transcript_17002:72-881(+)|eukprot:CAMPEP_0196781370 /NCGR_PEP_ID=MMETSP1104-20130614/9616_1 /TAXON_ID=33652 /ORGANISM="Cafeteria sp., Strain Caron Lab Isolate" /LENGTH=269 /DNA_ID=CAMNT_0042151599 /DNA_START=60 /DNA_END=869 /DNA_ORIENTATION=-
MTRQYKARFDSSSGTLCLMEQGLEHVPRSLASKFGSRAKSLMLTGNQVRSMDALEKFDCCDTLILDRNELSSVDALPRMPSLGTLWLNNNTLTSLEGVLTVLADRCPQLTYLSMLGNPCCPMLDDGPVDEVERRIHLYRVSVVARLPRLRFLDSRAVTTAEREAAAARAGAADSAVATAGGFPAAHDALAPPRKVAPTDSRGAKGRTVASAAAPAAAAPEEKGRASKALGSEAGSRRPKRLSQALLSVGEWRRDVRGSEGNRYIMDEHL